MTTEKKTNSEDKREKCFGFPFGGSQAMREMMRTCCPSETKVVDCCSMMQIMMSKKTGKACEE